MVHCPATRETTSLPADDPTEATAGPKLKRPRFHRLTAEQQLYLEQGIEQREIYRGEPVPEHDFDYELTLALCWFRNWWKEHTTRKGIRNRDFLTPSLPGLEVAATRNSEVHETGSLPVLLEEGTGYPETHRKTA